MPSVEPVHWAQLTHESERSGKQAYYAPLGERARWDDSVRTDDTDRSSAMETVAGFELPPLWLGNSLSSGVGMATRRMADVSMTTPVDVLSDIPRHGQHSLRLPVRDETMPPPRRGGGSVESSAGGGVS
ncbi:hypothetical protein OO015_13030 [Thermomicrobium sp. 4228-Ro]|uniref:hypothetical protein n=1 Tax=Thermomicrobium sp. 4228-Ro TaxID=2993937 RepID=UPI002249602C|nr:hypothetical protein [Thermomicrobium sp. 4228-Ro]MCX2728414.1 hypothetical protein [Thermomicrobium sp. 4228-Ro]